MMGHRKVEQAALFYEFPLPDHSTFLKTGMAASAIAIC